MTNSTKSIEEMKKVIKNCRTIYVNNKKVKDNWIDIEEINFMGIEFISWERKKKTLHLRTKLEKL